MKMFNAFSIQMTGLEFDISGKEISVEEAKVIASQEGVDSYIGHPDTANVLSSMLGTNVPAERRFGTIAVGETVMVAQVTGGRLPEGATTLPNGMQIKFCLVTRLS